MTLQILPALEQRSEEWYEQRRGMVTASGVGNLITMRKLGAIDFDCPDCTGVADGPCMSLRGDEPKPIKTMHPARAEYARTQTSSTVIEPASNDNSRSYTALLAAERITGRTHPSFINDDMIRGIDHEPIARDHYANHIGQEVTEIGFMKLELDGIRLGCSPDGLVGDDGMCEIKCPRQHTHMQTVVSGGVPAEYIPQLQCALLVSGRKWIDFVSFVGGMRLYVRRVYPDAKWQTAILAAVRKFEDAAQEMCRLYDEESAGMPMTDPVPDFEEIVI